LRHLTLKKSKARKTSSPYIVLKKSPIHNKGVFARKDIPEGTEVIEYVGELIGKSEAEKRGEKVLAESRKSNDKGAVYIFELNDKYDIDGNVSYNTAGYINHSCDPNCEAVNIDDHIWIVALRDIKKGEELSYNYGYGFENYEDHPCRCGAADCAGYILAEEHWHKLKKRRGNINKNRRQ
jgi:SET domain-containing protein